MAIETAPRTFRKMSRSDEPDAPAKAQKPAGIPNSPRREPNRIWMISGAAMVIVSGVIAFGIFSSLSDRVQVLATSRAIAEGEVVAKEDFEVVSISANSDVTAISLETYLANPELVIGKTANGPVGEGVLVDPTRFVDGSADDQGLVILGAALQPGQYPIAGLSPGDTVSILEISAQQQSDTELGGPRQLAEAEVVEVSPLGQTGEELFVSLEVAEADATTVAERVAESRVRLALIDYDEGSDQ